MMKKIFCQTGFLLVGLFLPVLLWAHSPDCFRGEWQLDIKNSDNPDRLLKKMERKQKQQERVLNRPSGLQNDEKADLSLADTLPAFVFLQENLLIEVSSTEVLLSQPSLVRHISTNDSGQVVSLKALEQQGDIRVAGWDKDSLVVETTLVDGNKVNEVFSLKNANTLFELVTIKQKFEKKIVIEKTYQRKNLSDNCITQ